MNPFFRKFQWFTHRDRREAEVRDELGFHLAEEAEDRRRMGCRTSKRGRRRGVTWGTSC
jgi:hypothetical protein